MAHSGTWQLAGRQWTIALRGVAAVLYGVVAITVPGASVRGLAVLFGGFAILTGVALLSVAAFRPGDEPRWRPFLVEGAASVAAGAAALLWRDGPPEALALVMGAWAVVAGAARLAAATRLRRTLAREGTLRASGVVSVGLGAVLAAVHAEGVFALVLFAGTFALAAGGLEIALSQRLRAWAIAEERVALGLPIEA